jgi:hypothetical protein
MTASSASLAGRRTPPSSQVAEETPLTAPQSCDEIKWHLLCFYGGHSMIVTMGDAMKGTTLCAVIAVVLLVVSCLVTAVGRNGSRSSAVVFSRSGAAQAQLKKEGVSPYHRFEAPVAIAPPSL